MAGCEDYVDEFVGNIAAGSRSLAVSLGEGGRMVRWSLSTSGLVDEECRSDCRRSWRGPSLHLLLVLVPPR